VAGAADQPVPVWDGKAMAPGAQRPAAMTLLPLLRHVPGERNQGRTANDWVWAATAALEMALLKDYGIQDRLSVQYFNSAYRPLAEGDAPDACLRSEATTGASVARPYAALGKLVPWSNPGAHYQDGELQIPQAQESKQTAEVFHRVRGLREPVLDFPCYYVNALEFQRLATSGVGIMEQEAINAIKDELAQGKVVIFNDSKKSTAIVGYTSGAAASWIILDSAGTGGNLAEDGTFRQRMTTIDYQDARRNSFEVVRRLDLDLGRYPRAVRATITPSELTLSEGDRMRLRASANLRPPVRYQWFHNGLPIFGPEATASTYEVVPASLADRGGYQVEVTSSYDQSRAESDPAEVTVNPRKVAASHAGDLLQAEPALVRIDPGAPVALCEGEGLYLFGRSARPCDSCQWLLDGEELEGANSLWLTREFAVLAGRYSVRVTIAGQPYTSNEVEVTVVPRGAGTGGAPRLEHKTSARRDKG
jgi:hypothetical protein